VITVPAYFSEVQREAVRRAAAEAKLVVHRIVNEPTAAAVAYGHKQAKKARVAVWDFGGGTFDFSVVDLSAGQLEVLATGGDNFVGGSDFDDLIASHLLVEFQRTEGIEIDPSPQQIARLREVAELAKRALSVQSEYVAELPEFTREPLKALRVEITRDRFDAITANLVLRTVRIATEVMSARKLEFEDIDDVILVGGSTRVPAVQNAVTKLFGRRPSRRGFPGVGLHAPLPGRVGRRDPERVPVLGAGGRSSAAGRWSRHVSSLVRRALRDGRRRARRAHRPQAGHQARSNAEPRRHP
jgi:molecular chaperone DnaK